MFYCSNCGNPLESSGKFCAKCGAPIPQNGAYTASEAPVVVEPVPQVCGTPVCSTKAKVLGFVGMGLSIGGIVMAVLGILYTCLSLATDEVLAFAFSFAFGIFSLPLSIVGGILSDRSSFMGNRSAACSVGAKLRVAGIIVSAVMLFLGFISLFL